MIEGVVIKKLRGNADERGCSPRSSCDEEPFEKFGQIYVSLNYPDDPRLHYHKKQDDFWAVVKVWLRCALRLRDDLRPREFRKSFSRAEYVAPKNSGRRHARYKTIGTEPSLLLNLPTERISPPNRMSTPALQHDEIPYDWISSSSSIFTDCPHPTSPVRRQEWAVLRDPTSKRGLTCGESVTGAAAS